MSTERFGSASTSWNGSACSGGAVHKAQLSGKLRELRSGPWRITYFADPKRRSVLLTSFRKTGRRTDPREIERGRRLMRNWQRRSQGDER